MRGEPCEPNMAEIMRTYGGLRSDYYGLDNGWGIWCSSEGGFYISYTSIEAMYENIMIVMLGEVEQVEDDR